uniref:Uncharacterized protein n=1 Tax=Octopus bimaculoides TaxID=37653 RepID=A0A0L8IGP4_OCTBM
MPYSLICISWYQWHSETKIYYEQAHMMASSLTVRILIPKQQMGYSKIKPMAM